MKQTNKTKRAKSPKNPFAEFYSLLRKQPEYNEAFRDEIKKGIVWKFSGEVTDSLKELYQNTPASYAYMIKVLKGETDSDSDSHRKQLLAALCKWLDLTGRKFPSKKEKLAYAKRIAERASEVEKYRFNDIPILKLIALYSLYCKRNEVLKQSKNDFDESKN